MAEKMKMLCKLDWRSLYHDIASKGENFHPVPWPAGRLLELVYCGGSKRIYVYAAIVDGKFYVLECDAVSCWPAPRSRAEQLLKQLKLEATGVAAALKEAERLAQIIQTPPQPPPDEDDKKPRGGHSRRRQRKRSLEEQLFGGPF